MGGVVADARRRAAARLAAELGGCGIWAPDPAPAARLHTHRSAQYRTVPAKSLRDRARTAARSALPKLRPGAVRNGDDLVEQGRAGERARRCRGARTSAS